MSNDLDKKVKIEPGKCYAIENLYDHSIIWLKCTSYSYITNCIRGQVIAYGLVSDVGVTIYNDFKRYKITEVERR
jgi:hypothetical protein